MVDSIGNVLDNTAHEYRECSNNGYCDRNTGECRCFSGYEGSACQRVMCPTVNGLTCSGHGLCQSAAEYATTESNNIYKLWDADTSMICRCDAGYFGPACEQRSCKIGFDPIYLMSHGPRFANYSYVIYIDSSSAAIYGNYTLIFHDVFGKAWHTPLISFNASCSQVTAALEMLPNNVIPAKSVNCVLFPQYHDLLEQDEPIYEASKMFYGLKYTLTFPKNPGVLKQPLVNTYINSRRSNLFSSSSNHPPRSFVYPNGFSGEFQDYFENLCEGVDVNLQYNPGQRYFYLSGLTPVEFRLLSQCLGDSDGNPSTSSETGMIGGVEYSWDYGTALNPHLVKLVDMTINPVTDLCPGDLNSRRDGDVRCFSSGNAVNPGFFVPLIYDPLDKVFKVFIRAGLDYSSYTKFAVYTTKGVMQMVSPEVAITTDFRTFYSSVVYSVVANSSRLISNSSVYDGDLSCETNGANINGALDCVERGDLVMFFCPNVSRIDINPRYVNLYSVTRIGRSTTTSANLNSTSVNEIELDMSINGAWNRTLGVSIYKFIPAMDDSYEYASSCGNRGNCDQDTGVCDCFASYSNDDCSLLDSATS